MNNSNDNIDIKLKEKYNKLYERSRYKDEIRYFTPKFKKHKFLKLRMI